tara:strand:- start:103 stop:519 length:417 start_codon:yes stop_codon:yes gene_type:complete
MSLALYGIKIETHELYFKSLSIQADFVFSGRLLVSNKEGQPISGATVNYTANIPLIGYCGPITGLTDSNGEIVINGATTINNTLTIEADGYSIFEGVLNAGFGTPQTYTLSQGSKKIWNTNKGNIMFNPNDTILIEIS